MVSAARRRIVFKSIESAIRKGQEVEYWSLRMYEQLEAGVLTMEQVSQLEALIEAYYAAQDAEPEPVEVEGEDEFDGLAPEGE